LPPVPARENPENYWTGVGAGWAVTSTMLAGVLVVGGIGWLIDWLLGTEPVFLAIGMVAGAICGTYLVYLRFGKGKSAD